MARRLLFPLAVSSYLALTPACILPTPLEVEKQSTQFPPPVILGDATDPKIGPLSLGPVAHPELNIVAEDGDENLATLHAQLYIQKPGSLVLAPAFGTTSVLNKLPETDTLKFRYVGPFPQRQYCGELISGTLLWVFVSDQPFSTIDPTMTQGQVDKKFWVLECTQ